MNKNQTVLEYLKTGKTLTTKKAKKKLGIDQVGKQIYALRSQGHEIVSYNYRAKSDKSTTVRYVWLGHM
jgi:hypothetical protein